MTTNPLALLQIHELVAWERIRHGAIGYSPTHDDENRPEDWVCQLTRQLGLMAPDTGKEPDPAHWERQLIRLMATCEAALASHYRECPERLGKRIHPTEGNEGRVPLAMEGE